MFKIGEKFEKKKSLFLFTNNFWLLCRKQTERRKKTPQKISMDLMVFLSK